MTVSPATSTAHGPGAVLGVPAADPAEAARHFAAKLAVETDPADLHADLAAGRGGFTVVDARSRADFDRAHIPGAVSLPHPEIDAGAAEGLRGRGAVVVYCWGVSCNAAARAAMRLAGHGIHVKELVGGIQAWRAQGYDISTGSVPGS